MSWIIANREWLFSGAGLVVLSGFGLLIRFGYVRWRESRGNNANGVGDQLAHSRVAAKPLQSRVPGFLLRPFLKPEDIRDRVRLALREEAPVTVSLGSQVPLIDLYFQVTNLSPVDLILDRMLVDVWCGQPTFSASIVHRYVVPAGEVTQGIHVRQTLADNQKAQIEGFKAARGSTGRVYVYMTAYFESKLGRFFVQRSIERQDL